MEFCTAINCMDGRTQLPVNEYMRRRTGAQWVDTITEPGPVAILDNGENQGLLDSLFTRLDISVNKHGSTSICVVGHHGCAGNPVDKETQLGQIRRSVEVVRGRYPGLDVVGLWVGPEWTVEEV